MKVKSQIVILSYDPEAQLIEVEEITPGRKPVKGVMEGMTVQEFKKHIRDKLGDKVEIINKVKRNREIYDNRGSDYIQEKVDDDEKYNMKDIRECMRNEGMKKGHG